MPDGNVARRKPSPEDKPFSRENPTIAYDDLVQPIHLDAQYLLMEARLKNGTYTSEHFIRMVDHVSLDGVTEEECRNNVNNQRQFLKIFAQPTDLVTIKDFYPNRLKLEAFVNTTFSQMYQRIHTPRQEQSGPELSHI